MSTKVSTNVKTAFSVFLVLHCLTEWMAAAVLLGGPQGIAAAGTPGANHWLMHYGFAAFVVGSASVWVWRYRSDLRTVTTVLGLLATFHVALTCTLSLAGDQPQGLVFHAVLAVFAIVLFTQRGRWCSA